MQKCRLGKKVGMTQIFTDEGIMIPVTVIQAGPVSVLQKKTTETDGYNAIKVGFEDIKEKEGNKQNKVNFAKAGVSAKKTMKEFRLKRLTLMKSARKSKFRICSRQATR